MRSTSSSVRRSISAEQASVLPGALLAAVAMLAGCGRARGQPDLAGQWQLSWQGRIGTEQATLRLAPHGQLLRGSVITPRGDAPLSGSFDGARLSFTVQFPGPPAYRIRFSGIARADQLEGEAQPQDGTGSAFAGHGGEVAHDYYRWSAVRTAAPPLKSIN
jgi:hypothetical protein